jgi:polysaccharide pyruvyl transferase WcaK-like protein
MAKMSFFIGFRHHSAVLAAKMLIPCICVSYEHKAISFMEDIQLDKYAIAIEDLSYSGLVSMIETIMADSADVKTHLKKISNDIRDKALLSSQKFYEMTAGKL